jgi:UDP-N-acetylglucosamine pyrophosphorylase
MLMTALRINPIRLRRNRPGVSKIDLDPKYYGKIDDLEKRFRNGIPSLVDCDALTIEGDVFFEKDVKIKGSVRIVNRQQSQAIIKEGTVLDQDLVF